MIDWCARVLDRREFERLPNRCQRQATRGPQLLSTIVALLCYDG